MFGDDPDFRVFDEFMNSIRDEFRGTNESNKQVVESKKDEIKRIKEFFKNKRKELIAREKELKNV